MPPRVAVVIPNWNGERFLPLCLTTLRDQSFADFTTIMVDNGSSDGSVDLVERDFPEVRVLTMGKNAGFSAAVNAGIGAADGTEYVALLNNDTEVDRGWLAALVRGADAHGSASLFASKLVDFEDRSLLDGAGDALRRSGLPYRLGHGERDHGQFGEPEYVFGACAAAALYRRSLFEEIGLFDEDFFAYCEDGDLSMRAQLAGHRCLYTPEAVVYHVGSASSGGKRSAFAVRLGTRNSLLLLVKNLPAALVPRMVPYILAGQLARFLVSVATSTSTAHLAGWAGALRLLPLMLRKRRTVQARRRLRDEEVRVLLERSSKAARASMRRRLLRRLKERLASTELAKRPPVARLVERLGFAS